MSLITALCEDPLIFGQHALCLSIEQNLKIVSGQSEFLVVHNIVIYLKIKDDILSVLLCKVVCW